MATGRKVELDRRLEAHFATLCSPFVKAVPRRTAVNWQIFAAVTGSAMAMATAASASIIGNGIRNAAEPAASSRHARQLASSQVPPSLIGAPRLIAGNDAGQGPFNGARAPRTPTAVQTSAPSIAPGGVVPVFGARSTIQPGEWVSIYGQHLASQAESWNGEFPLALGGVSVTIDGRPAYLSYVSPTQINLQAPDDAASGTVSVVVTNDAGQATASPPLRTILTVLFSLVYWPCFFV